MGVRPPFLFDAEPGAVTVRQEFDAEITMVGVSGTWSVSLSRKVSVALRKCFSEHPRGLIVDLAELGDPGARSWPAWLTAYRRGGHMDPAVRVALCAPEATALGENLRARAGHLMPIYARTGTAQGALETGLPLAPRVDLSLHSEPGAPARARRLVREACEAWELPGLAYAAQLIVSELVANMVEHTGGGGRILVARRGNGVHVAVADSSRELPRIDGVTWDRPEVNLNEGGRGLRIVHEASAAWGAMPIEGGKVVWALVREPIADW